MNGRQVFNFLALIKVPAHLHELLDASGLKSSDIDAFCIHQGSAAIVDAVARRFEEQHPEKFVKDMLLETGNTVSSSVPAAAAEAYARWQLEARGDQRLWRGLVVGLGHPVPRLIPCHTQSARRPPPGAFFVPKINFCLTQPIVGAGSPAKKAARSMAPASPVFAGEPVFTDGMRHSAPVRTVFDANKPPLTP